MISVEIWHDNKLWSEFDYEPEVNQMETMESLFEAFDALEVPGERFTLIAYKIS